MKTQLTEKEGTERQAINNVTTASEISNVSAFQVEDNRSENVAQLKIQSIIRNNSNTRPIQKYENITEPSHHLISGDENHASIDSDRSVKLNAYALGTDTPVAFRKGGEIPAIQMKSEVGLEGESDEVRSKSLQLGEPNVTTGRVGVPSPKRLKMQQSNISSKVSQLRSEQVIQRQYAWSEDGEDGVLIGDGEDYVIKMGGYDGLAVPLDQLGEQFGFTTANARIVKEGDPEWSTVERAVEESGGWNRDDTAEPKTEALVMDRVVGDPLHETVDSVTALDPSNPTEVERGKIVRLCTDLGKMLVMDLLTRNNDRFNLTMFDDDLLATDVEKQLDGDEWRPWMANEGNILVDPVSGAANPIDSQFTDAANEPLYAHNVAKLLTSRIDDLVASGMLILSHNWSNEDYAKEAFKNGIQHGIHTLLNA